MREQTVAIYCLLDDLLRVVQPTGPRKADPRRRLSDAQVLTTVIQHHRKAVETAFSTLTARFPKQIHAVTAQGFVLKLLLFVFTHALAQVGR